MPDRTADMAQFIREAYPTFEFVPVRLSNAFDKRWWEEIRGAPMTKSDFAVQLDPGALRRPITPASDLNALPCRTRIQNIRQLFFNPT